ncbi:hypothetical protein ILUMI_05640 [Ignelater luminosus]|uniref:ABC transmembrane type-1 domain-containing protein n=1 Tax=Ignelater luminosus TaxID=2038154 RepID=A0A8K0DBW5_IGNLU|nr:hypothetical protein ILUMI_05640 [Ignelater luminosus]
MDNEVHKKKREINPRENANILSIILFIFAFKTLRKGLRKGIVDEDIYEILKDYRSDKLGDQLENEWEKEKKKSKTVLLRCLFKIFGLQFAILAIILLVVEAPLMIIETWCTGKVVSYFEPRTKLTRNDALVYTTGLVGCSLAFTFFDNAYLFLLEQLSLKIRIACSSLLYRKCLKLNLCSLFRFANGAIVTLLTKDVFAFDMAVHFGEMIFAGTIEVIILTALMYKEIGVASIYGSSLLFVLLPVQGKNLKEF